MDVLVTYDISTVTAAGPKRLARVAAVCERYGIRVQYSVFECRVSPPGLVRFMGELADEIDPAVDSVHVYRFPGRLAEGRTSLGRPVPREPSDPWIV